MFQRLLAVDDSGAVVASSEVNGLVVSRVVGSCGVVIVVALTSEVGSFIMIWM